MSIDLSQINKRSPSAPDHSDSSLGTAKNGQSAKNKNDADNDVFGERKKKKKAHLGWKERITSWQNVSLRDKIFFVQNLRVMIKGGLSLGEAMRTIGNQTANSLFRRVINEVSAEVEAGVSLADAISKHPRIFNELFVNMIRSGEVSGNLEDVLAKLHIQMKRDHDLISKVKGAMVYPLVVIVAMIGIGTAMIIFVIPKLTSIFEEVGAELPLATRILIGASKFIRQHGPIVVVLTAVFLFVFVKFYRSETGRRFWHNLFLRIPVFSKIVKKINLARFCRTTSSLLKTDISIVESLHITSLVVGNIYYKRALEEASHKITKGLQINKVLAAHPKLFPLTVLQMMKVGEESGAVDSVLEEVAQFYEEDINQVMESLPSLIEPVLILFLGLGVGAMAVAIIMPMYSLSNAF